MKLTKNLKRKKTHICKLYNIDFLQVYQVPSLSSLHCLEQGTVRDKERNPLKEKVFGSQKLMNFLQG